MFANYFKIALRSIQKNKLSSLINILGLSLGLACTFLISFWVKGELSFDQFHRDKDRIYRILAQGELAFFGSPAPLAPTIEQELPEIEDAVRVRRLERLVFKYGEKAFYEDNGIVADPSFLDVFTFPLIAGNPKTVFSSPFNIVITEKTARRYFGDDDPINKAINIEGEGFLTVAGVLADVPQNSHLQFDYILPYRFLEEVRLCGLKWGDFNFMTYIKLSGKESTKTLGEKITAIAMNHDCPQVKHMGLTFFVQPLLQMYLNPVGSYDIPLGNMRDVYIFSSVALFILFIACINFINLSTAKSGARSREIGLRKAVGASRKQLIVQFFGEFLVLAFVSLLLSFVLVELFSPLLKSLSGRDLSLGAINYRFILLVSILTIVAGLVAGLYPAIFLSSFSPVDVLKNKGQQNPKRRDFRRALVVAQFVVSILLIICTVVVFRQMQYIRDKSWNIENDVIIHMPVKENIGKKYDPVKAELLKHPNIVAVTAKDVLPTGRRNNTTGVSWEGKTDAQNNIHMETTRVDYDYFETLDLQILQGRSFSKDFPSDLGQAYILNEEAVRQMGIGDALGKRFALYGQEGTVIGIVKDCFYQSLKQAVHPQVYHLFTNIANQGFFGAVLVRVRAESAMGRQGLQDVLAHVRRVWESVNSTAPFEYSFLDETIEAQYRDEQRLLTLFGVFAILAIVISCLGLFGLVTFVSETRTKEIGIRKVLGSTVLGIVQLLSKQFTGWVLIANLIAWPVAYYAMNRWLQNFVYHVNVEGWVFPFAGVMVLVIALFTIGWQAIRAATANPVEALRYE